ncbi:Vegetative incompatibility protein HET-E-like protein [Hapsidospora chrysogenum ATCC 11550]|uniref:Vegetative incompatibility protein HET-E-like protein n=1 Tax=Hapsidospora chrysogenum (strain ATCC 11550 / CBS 779.69 / DSM 880 / IAM 14645 / JCM 23072 / IMI 49137) TaxID=857340 RepID=A0A086SV01_HAPC1|nr:Vegetative incompatibility protein HET-E-like protein [Hapsidospora chrysogenum ATCC 11550]
MRLRLWKRPNKGSPRPTDPHTDESAHSPKPPKPPKPPTSNPATIASTAPSGSQISADDDAGSRGPVGPPDTVERTPATASHRMVENDGSAPKIIPLWIRAYEAICDNDPKLVAAYKAVLSSELLPEAVCDRGGDGDDAENARQEMDRQVQEGLRRTEKAAARIDKMREGMRVVSSVKELISMAAKHAPEAAAAWAGICLLFTILENPLGESKVLRDGVSHVVSRMDWYWRLSELLETTHTETSGMRDELQRHIGHLYEKLLSHQMKSICSLFRGARRTIARDMIKLDDWANALQSVRDAEAVVQRDIDTFHDAEVRTLLNDISKQARDQHAQLQDISRAIRETDQNQKERRQDERTGKCLADLRLTDPRDDMRRIEDTKGGLFQGASNWILSSDDFRRWHSADDAQLLWIKGDPGKGKTMLMITVVQELKRQRSTNTSALSYFFCQGTDENLNSAAAVLRGLIYVLCNEQPSLASHLYARYDHAGAKLFHDANSFYALSRVLESILQDERLQRAYLAVDALDECTTDQDQLLRFIAGPGMASPHVKWLVSSRNIPKIEDLLKTDSSRGLHGSQTRLSLEVTQNAEQVALAVGAFIDHKLSTLGLLRDDHKTRGQIRDLMHKKANGTFLWVALVIDELHKTDGQWEMLEVLEDIPEALEGLYDRMMQQIRNLRRKTPEFCRLVLSATALAYQPLHLAELAIVSGLPAEISNHADSVRRVVDLCGSFLTVRGDVVYLIHQSVRDYLTRGQSHTILPSGPGQVHRTMFVRSIEALSDGRLRRDMYDLQHPGTTIDNVKAPEPDPLAGVRYSCLHWARHFCDVNQPGNSRSETEDLERIERFIGSVFLYWLEAAALLQILSEIIISIRQLKTALEAQSCEGRVMSLISDAVRFALHNRYIIGNAPLQAYVSALIFSPIDSLIRNKFSHEKPTWVNLKSIIESSWSPCMQTLEGHNGGVMSVAFSPDGRQIASGSYDDTIKVWDYRSGACTQTLEGHDGPVRFAAFSPDGRQIASSSHDSTIKVWDCESGVCMQTLEGHSDTVWSVAFSPDGRQIASGSNDGTIKVWDCESGACMQTLEGHSGSVWSVEFSPDGRHIASGLDNSTIKVWDCESSECTQTLEGHNGGVMSVAFSPNGQQITSGSHDDTIKVWDYKSGVCMQTLRGHSGTVWSVTFSPNGQQIASSSYDSTIKVWDCESSECTQTLEGHSNMVWSVAFSPDGRQIASGSDVMIKIWDYKSGVYIQKLEGHSDQVNSVAFSPGGQQIASCSDDGTIKVWDCKSGECTQTLGGHNGWVWLVAFSPDGQQIASSSDGTIKVWDCESGICMQTLEAYSDYSGAVRSAAFSPNGRQIASGSNVGTIKVWDCESGACTQTLEGHDSWVVSVAFSPDGRHIASGSTDGTIKVWDCESGACMQTLGGYNSAAAQVHSSAVRLVAFSLGDRQVAPGSGENDDHARGPICEYSYGVSRDQRWICRQEQNILWLPPDYRPSSSAVWSSSYTSTMSDSSLFGSTIALGCPSGRVVVLRLADDGPIML